MHTHTHIEYLAAMAGIPHSSFRSGNQKWLGITKDSFKRTVWENIFYCMACSLLTGTGVGGFSVQVYLNCAIADLCSHEVLFTSSLCTILLPFGRPIYHGVFIQRRPRTFWRAQLPVNWNIYTTKSINNTLIYSHVSRTTIWSFSTPCPSLLIVFVQ